MAPELDVLRDLADVSDDQTYSARGWYAPAKVTLVRDALRFSEEVSDALLLPRDGLLTRFVELENAPPRRIAQFARKWGRLYLCEHGLPHSHHAFAPKLHGPAMTYRVSPDIPSAPVPTRPDEWGEYEPLANWRYMAGRMRAVLEAATLIRLRKPVPLDVWDRAGGRVVGLYVKRFGVSDPRLLHGLALQLANVQVAIAAPRLSVEFTSATTEVVGLNVGGSGLPVALALQLAFAVGGVRTDFIFCSEPGCTNPANRPRKGATPYCGEHLGKGVRNRDAQRRHRSRATATEASEALS